MAPSVSPDAKSISLVIPGGISLGAYYAGAVAQLGYFLAQWDHLRGQGRTDLPRVQVDVISGASAGAITGAVLFRFIGSNYFRAQVEEDDVDQRCCEWLKQSFDSWCSDNLSFPKLLAVAVEGKYRIRRSSFLNNEPIEAIADEVLGSIDFSLPPDQEKLIYTCTLTSVEPVKYSMSIDGSLSLFDSPPDGQCKISANTRRDWVTFRMHRHNGDYESRNVYSANNGVVFEEIASDRRGLSIISEKDFLWERVRLYTLASGAFPIAWNPIRIERSTRYYPDVQYGRQGYRTFVYADGGLIDNMPLNRACKVLRDFDVPDREPKAGKQQSRVYLLIQATRRDGPVAPVVDIQLAHGLSPERCQDFDQKSFTRTLFESMREQSFFDDLRDARRLNRQIKSREVYVWPKIVQSAVELRSDLIKGQCRVLQREIGELLVSRVPDGAVINVRAARRQLVREMVRSREFQGSIGDQLLDWRQVYYCALRVVLEDIINEVARKQFLQVAQVSASRELCSRVLGNFGGFLELSYRRQDFITGLESMGDWLRSWLAHESLSATDVNKVIACSETLRIATGVELPEVVEPPANYRGIAEETRLRFERILSGAIGDYFPIGQCVTVVIPLVGAFGAAMGALALSRLVLASHVGIVSWVVFVALVFLVVLGLAGVLLYFMFLRNPAGAVLRWLDRQSMLFGKHEATCFSMVRSFIQSWLKK